MIESSAIYGCKYVFSEGTGRPIILLHGYSFTYQVWIDIGLLDELKKEDIPFLALDMPYGRVSSCREKISSTEENIKYVRRMLLDKFGEEVPVLIGASLGGYNALRYGMQYDVMGLILIAPVWSTREDILEVYREKNVPILLIYGDKDTIVDLEEMERFRDEVPNVELKIYSNAKHPAYLDKPQEFVKDVLEFYKERLGLKF